MVLARCTVSSVSLFHAALPRPTRSEGSYFLLITPSQQLSPKATPCVIFRMVRSNLSGGFDDVDLPLSRLEYACSCGTCSMPHLSLCCRYSDQQSHQSTPDKLKSASCAEYTGYPADKCSVAPRQIHICPRHSQLSVIAHAIAWVCTFSPCCCVIPSSPPFFFPTSLSTLLPGCQHGQDQDN